MKLAYVLCGVAVIICFTSCATKNGNNMAQEQHIAEELTKINDLLRDTSFAIVMAGGQEAAFAASQGQTPSTFFEGTDSTLKKSCRDEKIAINLAGFYAVECGIGALVQLKGETPVYWLQQIVNKTIDSNSALLLNRFANATWKAGQPFRGLDRITRDNFIVANFLSAADIQKDADQVTAAAAMLLDSLKHEANAPAATQLATINKLLKDKQYALEMAKRMEAAYYLCQHKPVPAFLSPADDTAEIKKSAREEKIATNIAGFYALECGVNYLATTQHKLPSAILKSITADSLDQKDKQLLNRFANATWKAGQPFRNLDRITRDIFKPFDLLPPVEVEKDWVQVKAAAERLTTALQ
jgi:hypothetical protein